MKNPDYYDQRLDRAIDAVIIAADAYCWDSTDETEAKLREAVAEWRSAVGLVKLRNYSRMEKRDA